MLMLLVSSGFGGSAAAQTAKSPLKMDMENTQDATPARGTELDGCLSLHDGEMPKLTLFHSQKFYRLEGRQGLLAEHPLAFAQNSDALVHVTGSFGAGTDIYDPDHSPVFVVDAIEQLASNCDEHESLSEVRKRIQELRAASPAEASSGGRLPIVLMTGELLVFKPAVIEIRVGQTVEWKNSSGEPHTVTADPRQAVKAADIKLPKGAEPFDSGYLNAGQTFRHMFTTAGVYRYACVLHEVQGMIGEVIVKP